MSLRAVVAAGTCARKYRVPRCLDRILYGNDVSWTDG